VREGDDVLEGVVFEDVEVGLGEVLDEVAVLIDDGAVEDDFVDIAGEGVDALAALDFLIGVGVAGADGGVIGGVGGDDGVVVDVEGGLGFGELGGWDVGGRCGLLLGGLGRGWGGGGLGAEGRECGDGEQEEEEESRVTAGTHRIRNVHAQ